MSKKGLILCLFLICQCGSNTETSSEFPYSKPLFYFRQSTQVTVEVYYEPGATPYTGATGMGLVYWSILRDNLNIIFSYRSAPPVVNVPQNLSGMTALPDQANTSWTTSDILALHRNYRSALPTADHARFYIYFLEGYSSEGSNVIGLSITGTPVIAIFKDVVTASAIGTRRFVEQSTLVHEIGHALGFVNNGVPMSAPHQDVARGAHTTNSNCVMYWQNEGLADLEQFLQTMIATENPLLWGPEVLADAQAYSL